MRDPKWLVAFPLEEAALCVNCENVGNSAKNCVVCQSEQLLPLAKILNHKGENDERPVDPGDLTGLVYG